MGRQVGGQADCPGHVGKQEGKYSSRYSMYACMHAYRYMLSTKRKRQTKVCIGHVSNMPPSHRENVYDAKEGKSSYYFVGWLVGAFCLSSLCSSFVRPLFHFHSIQYTIYIFIFSIKAINRSFQTNRQTDRQTDRQTNRLRLRLRLSLFSGISM